MDTTTSESWFRLHVVIIVVAVVGAGIVLPLTIAYAYDKPPVVDTPRETATRSAQPQVYRFGESVDDPVIYSDGTTVPSRTFSIQVLNQTTGQWETIGYANTHLHKVKVDHTDELDVSVGTTTRINPKTN
jgi:hypothetical protein